MNSQLLWQVSVTTIPAAEVVVAALLEQVFAQPASTYADWKTRSSTVSVFCRHPLKDGHQHKALLCGLAQMRATGAEIGSGRVSCRRLPRQDWAESWKRHFKVVEFGPALLVRPSWVRRRPLPGQVEVVLDPGLSFGTGQHPTTGFCLRQLVHCRKHGQIQSFLDIGTGSGILAIAAAKLGYDPVTALDFDPESIRVARANAKINQIGRKLMFFKADLARMPLRGRTRHDLICANLISPLLLAQGRRLVNRLKPGGRLVLAGILRREFSSIQENYKRLGLKFIGGRSEKEWRSGAFVLK